MRRTLTVCARNDSTLAFTTLQACSNSPDAGKWRSRRLPLPETNVASNAKSSQAAAALGTVIQAVAALMVQASRPEFLSHELVNLLGQTGCVRRAAALLVDRTHEPELLAATDAAGVVPYVADAWPRRLVVGPVRDRVAELWLEPSGDIESTATVNAVALLLSAVHENRARSRRA